MEWLKSMQSSLESTNKTLNDFDGIVGPTLDLIQTLNDKNSLLKKSRDRLLPKLVFGELDVSDLDMVLKG